MKENYMNVYNIKILLKQNIQLCIILNKWKLDFSDQKTQIFYKLII